MKIGLVIFVLGALFCGVLFLLRDILFPRPEYSWGINARISELPAPALKKRLDLIRDSGVHWLREDYISREPQVWQQADNFTIAREKGFQILSLIPYSVKKKPNQPANHLRENLDEVYQAAKAWSETSSFGVGAWELYNEADVGFCRDLPDRSVAYNKAVYLGLRDGALPASKPVLMGALALPPGPWLEKAARNGLLDYADAYNFHYYGQPDDLPAVLSAHRDFLQKFSQKQLPIWITECGYAARDNEAGQLKQADYFQKILALLQKEQIASFMPYSLKDPRGFAMLNPNDEPLPSWKVFAHWSRERSPGNGPIFLEGNSPSPIICQWLPKIGEAIPHKVSGTYRFRPNPDGTSFLPMNGEIRIYNFQEHEVSGELEISGLQQVRIRTDYPLTVKVMARGYFILPIAFETAATNYFQEWCTIQFKPSGGKPTETFFGLEATPSEKNFCPVDLPVVPFPKGSKKTFQYINDPEPYQISSEAENWIGLNGLQLSGSNQSLVLGPIEKSAENAQPMAVALLSGLPKEGFLRLKSDQIFDMDSYIRVDLIDAQGQRFTIFENAGMSYFEKRDEVWLNLRDFHLYFWGRCVKPVFDPSSVREIQLRPSFKKEGQKVALTVNLMVPSARVSQ